MIMLGDIDYNLKYEYELILCKSNGTQVAALKEVDGISLSPRFPTTDQLTFVVPKYVMKDHNRVRNINFDLINNMNNPLILLNNQKYFIVEDPNESYLENDSLEFTCYSREYELSKRDVFDINDTYELYDSTEKKGILNILEAETSWRVGTIEPELLTKSRTFEIDKTKWSELIVKIQESFECVFVYNTLNKTIDVKTLANCGTNRGLYISKENYLKSAKIEKNTNEVVTRLRIYGKDGLTITGVNPTGETYLENFSAYRNLTDMDQPLLDALTAYDTLVASKTTEYQGLQSQLTTLQTQKTPLDNQLSELQVELAEIQDLIDVAIKNKQSVKDLNKQKRDKQTEIDGVQTQIDAKQVQIDDVNDDISAIHTLLKKENNFTAQQLYELDDFIKDDEYTDELIDNEQELLAEGKKRIDKVSQPAIMVTIDSEDFLSAVKAQHNWDKLRVGDIINIEIDDGVLIQFRLVSYTHNKDSNSLSLEFSNKDSYDDPAIYQKDLMSKMESASTSVKKNKYNWNKSVDNESKINNVINSPVDTSKNKVIAGKNQEFIADERGVWITNQDNPDRQLRILSDNIFVTTDGGENWDRLISPSGTDAEQLIGQVIAGSKVVVTNETGSFLVDSDRVTIKDLILELVRSDNKSRILLDTSNGIKIQKFNGSTWQDKFYADTDGVLNIEDLVAKSIKIKMSGESTATLIDAETGKIDFDAFVDKTGTLGLGGTTNLQIQIFDSNNDSAGELGTGGSESSLSNLTVGTLQANNIISKQYEVSLYVNSSTGNDNNDGSLSTPFATIQKAIDSLEKYLVENVYIYCTGTFIDDIYISGFIGIGSLYLKLQTSTIKGSLNCVSNSTLIQIEGTSDVSRATIEAVSNFTPFQMFRCQYAYLKYVKCDAKQLSSYSCYINSGGHFSAENCSFTNATHSGIAIQYSKAWLSNCKGKSNQYGAYVLGGSFAGFNGTVPNGITSWNYTAPDSESRYGTVTPTDDTIDGSSGTSYITTTYNSIQSGTYREDYAYWRSDNNYLYQGSYGGNGNYTGAMWFDNTTLRSNLSGKTVSSAKLYLKRRDSGGISGGVSAYLVGITNSSESGSPNRVTSYGSIGSWSWNTGGKWVSIPVAAINDLENSVINALAIYNGSSGYMILEGYDNATYKPKLQVTYY